MEENVVVAGYLSPHWGGKGEDAEVRRDQGARSGNGLVLKYHGQSRGYLPPLLLMRKAADSPSDTIRPNTPAT